MITVRLCFTMKARCNIPGTIGLFRGQPAAPLGNHVNLEMIALGEDFHSQQINEIKGGPIKIT